MPGGKYSLRYIPRFEEDLNKILDYIAFRLHNPVSAINLVKKIETAIYDTPPKWAVFCIESKGFWAVHLANPHCRSMRNELQCGDKLVRLSSWPADKSAFERLGGSRVFLMLEGTPSLLVE